MKPTHKKPTARVMWAEFTMRRPLESTSTLRFSDAGAFDHCIPVAVIPLPATRARKLVKFANMTEEEKVKRVAAMLPEIDMGDANHGESWEKDYQSALAILQSIGLIGGGR